MSLVSGTRLGLCEIVAPLGAGGMGEVHEARDTRLDRTVVIKVVSAHLAADPALLAQEQVHFGYLAGKQPMRFLDRGAL